MSQHPPLLRSLMLLAAIVALALSVVPAIATAQDPDRPEDLPYYPFFRDPDGVYDESQRVTLERDARLLQSSGIPTLVFVRITNGYGANHTNAQAAADDLRAELGVESAPGADDGLVLLYSHVPTDPAQGSIVASWGAHAFDKSGLTPRYIVETLARDPRALLDQGHPFEALVYAMRQVRYGGIYFPPPPRELSGTAELAHAAANIAGPVLTIVATLTYIAISFRSPSNRLVTREVLIRILAITFGGVALLWALSVHGQSEVGIASVLAILVVFAIQVWVWTHASRRQLRPARRRSVPSTTRRMRKRMQARRLHPEMEGRA